MFEFFFKKASLFNFLILFDILTYSGSKYSYLDKLCSCFTGETAVFGIRGAVLKRNLHMFRNTEKDILAATVNY